MNLRLFLSCFSVVFFMFSGCSITNDLMRSASTDSPSLGAIVVKNNAIRGTFEQKSQVSLRKSIALSISKVPFTQSTLRRASRVLPELSKMADSLLLEQHYVVLEITDDILLSEIINEDAPLLKYLQTNIDSKVITKVWMLSSTLIPDTQDKLLLELTTSGALEIVSYLNGKKISEMTISEAEIFDLETSSFCWSQNKYGEWRIGDVVEEGRRCASALSRKLKKEKSKNLFDY